MWPITSGDDPGHSVWPIVAIVVFFTILLLVIGWWGRRGTSVSVEPARADPKVRSRNGAIKVTVARFLVGLVLLSLFASVAEWVGLSPLLGIMLGLVVIALVDRDPFTEFWRL